MTSNRNATPWSCSVDATVTVPADVYEVLQGAADSLEAQLNIVSTWDQAAREARASIVA
jgi:hypothetical protein